MAYRDMIGYCGILFAAIYRIPQIVKIYRTKRGGDVSKKSFILHNGAYISFIVYLVYGKENPDYILLIYYCIGIFQNLIILIMKEFYKTSLIEDEKPVREEKN